MNKKLTIDGITRWVREHGQGFTWAHDADDNSPTYLGYDPRCGRCWLGQSHSVSEHAQCAKWAPLKKK